MTQQILLQYSMEQGWSPTGYRAALFLPPPARLPKTGEIFPLNQPRQTPPQLGLMRTGYNQMSSVMASQQTTPSDTELLPPTSIDEDCTRKTLSKHKRSWVWVYFQHLNDAYVECQVLDCFGKACKKKLKRDLTGRTKGMSDHLTGFHQMPTPTKGL
ncbi:hypothetical protein O181_128160 [Austropuccinia psidii MF-1]|uniref:BED-type domain-containing protein n=1 Tax=Austropuccinia psidii MF-1 TaxID=1389203 RepID=A0A9Q3KZP4_9BASI|nr:hypothetical protein [Austropuccinia psidii MF-1]